MPAHLYYGWVIAEMCIRDRHTLIQTISRVNRVCEGKDKGLIVDYIGIKKNMNLSLIHI